MEARLAAIERKRLAGGWSHAELSRRAGLQARTWKEIRAGRREALPRTLDRLEAAFDQAPGKKPLKIVAAFHRMLMLELCRQLRAPADNVLAQDFTVQRPSNPAWLRAARINRMAIYVMAVELELENAELGRALGCTRQNVKQARDDVFDWIDDSKAIRRAIARVTAIVAPGRPE